MTGVPARLNPFRSARVEGLRFRMDKEGWRALLARLEDLGHRAALVGPEGSGKTTLLDELDERLAARGWRVRRFRLTREERRLTRAAWRVVEDAGPGDLLCVDGAEQLTWRQRRRLLRAGQRAGGLLVTGHRAGILPTLHEHRTDPALLADLVEELLGDDFGRVEGDLGRLFERHRGHLRDCLRELYDRWPSLAAVPASAGALRRGRLA